MSGQLLPPALLDHVARAGFRVRQIVREPIHFTFIPRTQAVALQLTNLPRDNDVQIAATYDRDDLAKLRAAVPSAPEV